MKRAVTFNTSFRIKLELFVNGCRLEQMKIYRIKRITVDLNEIPIPIPIPISQPKKERSERDTIPIVHNNITEAI